MYVNKCVLVTPTKYHFLPPLSPMFLGFLLQQQEPKMCKIKRYIFNLWEFLKGSFRFRLNPTAGSRQSLRKINFPRLKRGKTLQFIVSFVTWINSSVPMNGWIITFLYNVSTHRLISSRLCCWTCSKMFFIINSFLLLSLFNFFPVSEFCSELEMWWLFPAVALAWSIKMFQINVFPRNHKNVKHNTS